MKENLKKTIITAIGTNGKINAKNLAEELNITEQTVYRSLRSLSESGEIEKLHRGAYKLKQMQYSFCYATTILLKEDSIWEQDIVSHLPPLAVNAKKALAYIFAEMMNNAIEHSEANSIKVTLVTDSYSTTICISDDGIGIFEKISKALSLPEKKYAVLELAKGKFTTDPTSHTGEGIFFSSKIADFFAIHSQNIVFVGTQDLQQPVLMEKEAIAQGTLVIFEVLNEHNDSITSVFEKYTNQPDDYGFSKTMIPVKLVAYGEQDGLFMSRSQARRLLARLDKFENIELDFAGIDEIGQGFADEVFRVFANEHPNVKIVVINACKNVMTMIHHVKSGN